MKDARHMILWLFFGLLPMLGSCDFRDMLDDYPVSGVQIKLDWKGVTDKLPQTMRIIFYPKDTQGRKVESYLPAGGGEVKVPPGKYAVVAYNFNTESIQIRGDESYETIEAFTGHCTGLDVHEDMVWSPDPLYVVALDEVEIRQSDVALPLDWKPEAVVDHYSFDIKVEGWDRISSIICHVDGLNGSYFIGTRACHLSEVPICVDTKRENGLLWGYFSSFVLLKDTKTRADSPMLLTLKIVKRDKTVQEVKVDITEVIVPFLCEGQGSIRCQHGIIPVPVPAVVNIAQAHGLTLKPTGVQGELVTPTGAAIVAAVRTSDKLPQTCRIVKIGMGAGKREYEGTGILRAMLLESGSAEAADTIWRLESNLDDCSGEVLGFVMDELFAAGARDVYYTPIYMKKNRPAVQINIICREQDVKEKVTALDVDDQFGLVVRRADGTVETIRTGEVSVRGLYGYVE